MTDITWLVALLSPRSVAPHPNFASTDPRIPAGRLALLFGPRSFHDEGDDKPRFALTSEAAELIDAAEWVMTPDRHSDGTGRLVCLSRDVKADYGVRGAAALLASVSLSDTDHSAEAVSLLEEVSAAVPRESDDQRLISGALLQQLAMRLFEVDGQFAPVGDEAQRLLSSVRASDVTRYRTSYGSLWGAAGTNREVLRALQAANEDLFRPGIGWPDHKTLKRILTTPPAPLIAYAMRSGAGGADTFVEERFADFTQSNEESMRAVDPVDRPVWQALTLFELLGHRSLARSYRATLGQLRFMRYFHKDDAVVRDALRLLRRGDEAKAAQLALDHVRAAGPLAALAGEVLGVASAVTPEEPVAKSELRTLETGAQVLPTPAARNALDAVLASVETGPRYEVGSFVSRFTQLEDVFNAATALAPVANGADDTAAAVLRSVVGTGPISDDVLIRPHARAVAEIEWSDVSDLTRNNWRAWAADPAAGWTSLATYVGEQLGHLAPPPTQVSLERVTTALNGIITGTDPAPETLAWLQGPAATFVAEHMETTRLQAARGVLSFGPFQICDIAVGLVQYADADLWSDVTMFLIENRVPRSMRNAAFDRLASKPHLVPAVVRRAFADSAQTLLEPAEGRMVFDPEPVNPYPQAVRALIALGLLPDVAVLEIVTRLATGPVIARLEAARTLTTFVVAQEGPADWAVSLALQFSQDASANVRAEAGRLLAVTEMRSSFASQALIQRLLKLLSEDGILVPLLTLRGLTRDGRVLPDQLRPKVEDMAANHLAWGVRVEARQLLGPEAV